jgi:glycosyltransferase involved in cell wall biosynthesis
MKKVSIIIPALIKNHNIFMMTKELLDGLFKTKGIADCEIILIDDGSDPKFVKSLGKMFKQIKIIGNKKNLGFAKSINNGIRASKNDLILLLNNDIRILEKGWLKNLINGMEYFGWDIASPKQSILDNKCDYVPDIERKFYKEEKLFCYPVGWCLLVKRKVFEEVGLLPVNFGIGFWEDTAWFFMIKNKFKHIKYGIVENIDKIQIQHAEHTTFRAEGIDISEQYKRNRKIFIEWVRGEKRLNVPKLNTGDDSERSKNGMHSNFKLLYTIYVVKGLEKKTENMTINNYDEFLVHKICEIKHNLTCRNLFAKAGVWYSDFINKYKRI